MSRALSREKLSEYLFKGHNTYDETRNRTKNLVNIDIISICKI